MKSIKVTLLTDFSIQLKQIILCELHTNVIKFQIFFLKNLKFLLVFFYFVKHSKASGFLTSNHLIKCTAMNTEVSHIHFAYNKCKINILNQKITLPSCKNE